MLSDRMRTQALTADARIAVSGETWTPETDPPKRISARTGSRGKRIAVLGDMLELGTASVKLHRELAEPIGEAGIDRVYTIGTEIAVLGAALDRKVFGGHFKTWQAAEKPLGESLRAGDVIMLKASNGLRFGDLVEAMTRNYSVKPD